MLDLDHATRDEVIRLTLQQREALAERDRPITQFLAAQAAMQQAIADLTARVGELTQRLPQDDDPPHGTPTGMPGLKPTEPPVRERLPRKQRAHGAGRCRMQATARVVHALDACPDCGCRLAGGSIKRTREVIDLPRPSVVVTEHVYLERRCPACGQRCVPPPATDAVVLGKSRLGYGLVSLIAVLREDARLPLATIQTMLRTLTGLSLSVGALVGALGRVAQQATPVLAQIKDAIRASPVVHANETGWREDGRNGYVWSFSTPRQRYFLRDTREKRVVAETLGDDCAGVVVSDFYGAYTSSEGLHQYCWAHLLRDIHEVTEQHPDDAAVQGWADAVQAIFARAQAGATGDRAARRRARKQVATDRRTLCRPWREPRVAQTRLCTRILRHLESLFVFVTDPAVPTHQQCG